jgi:hypothetical protein
VVVRDAPTQIEEQRKSLEKAKTRLVEMETQLDRWVEQSLKRKDGSSGENTDQADLVTQFAIPHDDLSSQLVDLEAADVSVEDAILHFERALRNTSYETFDGNKFVREVGLRLRLRILGLESFNQISILSCRRLLVVIMMRYLIGFCVCRNFLFCVFLAFPPWADYKDDCKSSTFISTFTSNIISFHPQIRRLTEQQFEHKYKIAKLKQFAVERGRCHVR